MPLTEAAARINQIFEWILAGASEFQILEAINRTWPNEATKPLVIAALAEIRKDGELDAMLIRGWCFHASRELYRKMTEIGDFAGALRAVKQIQQMAGRD